MTFNGRRPDRCEREASRTVECEACVRESIIDRIGQYKRKKGDLVRKKRTPETDERAACEVQVWCLRLKGVLQKRSAHQTRA